jgi:formate dehydrogenase major subunit
MPERDETLQHPRTVLQLLKRHYRRYTPEMVEQVTGFPKNIFLKVAEMEGSFTNTERMLQWHSALASALARAQ